MPAKPYISVMKIIVCTHPVRSQATDLQMNTVTSRSLTTPSQNYGARSTSTAFTDQAGVWMKPWGVPAFLLLRSVSVHTASLHNPNYMTATRPACYMHASQDTQPDGALHACFIWRHDRCTFIGWGPRSRLSCWAIPTAQLRSSETPSYKSLQARTVQSQLRGSKQRKRGENNQCYSHKPAAQVDPDPLQLIHFTLNLLYSSIPLAAWVESF